MEKSSLNEVKVTLVGEGASGKTSLVKRLLNSSFDKKEAQTHGIKIIKHKFKVQGEDFLVNFWDFGGQEIMHATHQFFLTKRCLYVLVLDSRKDEKAEYWLNYIQSFGGNAPVIVVLNKIDENPSFDVNRQFLSKKYSNIQAYYKVSCANGDGINVLKKDIMSHLWGLELRSTAFPKGWFKVKTQMEAMPDDYIGYAQYQSICTGNHVHNTQSQKVLLELLNDLGVVLNYEQLRLYDTQVLNPLWLTNAVYRIINSPILAKSTGRFNINDLGAIINDPRYQKENPEHWSNIFKFWAPEQKILQFPEAKFLFIVAMMKQFEILFQLDEYHYLIPGLLSEEENTYDFKATDSTLAFVIEYKDFLPAAIIPRLMVKLHKYIHNNQIWKTGMVLEETLLFNSIANIVLDKESKKINIEIQGNRKRDFLSVIRETLKEINTSYQDLDVTEWIPLPELYKGEQVMVDYLELLGYEKMGQQQYFSGKLLKAFLVANLLNGIEKPEMRKEFNTCHIFISYSHLDQAYKEGVVKTFDAPRPPQQSHPLGEYQH
ncbi:MAG TPA: COR domain-containing protein [Haliscomenobacter sp.]|uniref:COR domain-containing protein n=1 Tax=Haliscomenobacter sp. TaxID=2717303 RepID=UPI002D1BBEF9|nr:COR domain-containing protein [Haliscomenobacter sp.]HOY21257.1 COR domain-containing protein [Haliscomenobacter sp.]